MGLTAYVRTCKGCLSNQHISSEESEALDLHSMLKYTKVVLSNQGIFSEKSQALDLHPMLDQTKIFWAIRKSFLRNWRHWTHKLYWNIQRLFEQSATLFEKSEALDSLPMSEHTKVVWAIMTFLLRNHRHQTHSLYWNIQRLCWAIGKYLPRNQRHWTHNLCWNNAKIVWVIRKSLLRHCTHSLCWNMQRLFKQSGNLFQDIKGFGLTAYARTCKGFLTNQDIPPEKSKALNTHSML